MIRFVLGVVTATAVLAGVMTLTLLATAAPASAQLCYGC